MRESTTDLVLHTFEEIVRMLDGYHIVLMVCHTMAFIAEIIICAIQAVPPRADNRVSLNKSKPDQQTKRVRIKEALELCTQNIVFRCGLVVERC